MPARRSTSKTTTVHSVFMKRACVSLHGCVVVAPGVDEHRRKSRGFVFPAAHGLPPFVVMNSGRVSAPERVETSAIRLFHDSQTCSDPAAVAGPSTTVPPSSKGSLNVQWSSGTPVLFPDAGVERLPLEGT